MAPAGSLRRVLREPLLHFLVLGVLIFAAIMAVRAHERPAVAITAQDIEQLVQYWQLQTQRAPSKAELATIIQGRIDEELLAREALRLGMDKDDLIIRRRLAQKMTFASEEGGDQPDERELRAAFERNRARYAARARLTLRHVVFSADRGAGAPAAAAAALAAAARGATPVGDPSMLPLSYADGDPALLARDYGAEFVRAAASAPLGRWVGPIRSPFGLHLIRVEARAAPEVPPFAAVRDLVRDDVLAALRQARSDAFLRKLRTRYRVSVEGVAP